jgi:hypothetical protein
MCRDEPFAVRKGKSAGYSREVFPEMQHRMETHVHSVCSRGRGSMSLRETEGDVSVGLRGASYDSVTPTRKQFLARLDLRVRLNANDDLPTRPSAVLPDLIDTGLAGAARSAICPER